MFIAHYVGFSEGEIEWALWGGFLCGCKYSFLSSLLVSHIGITWGHRILLGGSSSWI